MNRCAYRFCWSLLALACGAALPGCRTPANVQLLDRELRELEDYAYMLEDEVRMEQRKRESCLRENNSLRRQLAAAGIDPRESQQDAAAIERATRPSPLQERLEQMRENRNRRNQEAPQNEQQGPVIERPGDNDADIEEMDPEDFSPPGVELNGDAGAEDMPAPGAIDDENPGAFNEVSLRGDDSAVDIPTGEVARVTLSRFLTGGWNADSQPGDEGVALVLEPRNAKGDIIRAAGKLEVVVLDPAIKGTSARVARWSFSEAESAALFRKTRLGLGYHLELPWPNTPPEHRDLVLFVRLTTAGGAQFVVEKSIDVDPQLDGASPVASGPQDGWSATRSAAGALPREAPRGGFMEIDPRDARGPLVSDGRGQNAATGASADGGLEVNIPEPGTEESRGPKRGGLLSRLPKLNRPAWKPYR